MNDANLQPGFNYRDFERTWGSPGDFQFYCDRHDYGWSIDEDGIAKGCPQCNKEDE